MTQLRCLRWWVVFLLSAAPSFWIGAGLETEKGGAPVGTVLGVLMVGIVFGLSVRAQSSEGRRFLWRLATLKAAHSSVGMIVGVAVRRGHLPEPTEIWTLLPDLLLGWVGAGLSGFPIFPGYMGFGRGPVTAFAATLVTGGMWIVLLHVLTAGLVQRRPPPPTDETYRGLWENAEQ